MMNASWLLTWIILIHAAKNGKLFDVTIVYLNLFYALFGKKISLVDFLYENSSFCVMIFLLKESR